MITISIVYATPNQQIEKHLTVDEGCTVELAIYRSGLLLEFPELSLNDLKVGIYSQRVSLSVPVKENDRIEIYRPLLIDPKKARQLRANKKK